MFYPLPLEFGTLKLCQCVQWSIFSESLQICFQQTQKEREDDELKAEIRRKKNEEKEARDKILRQIEEDKLERKQRFSHLQSAAKPMTELEPEMVCFGRSQ